MYKALLWRDVFSISCMKWHKFRKNNVSVLLRSKQEGTLKLVNPKYEDWVSVQLLTLLFLSFLFTLPRFQVNFQWKDRKFRKCMKEFSRRFYLTNGKHLSIFLGFFARIVNVTHFAYVINLREKAHGKIHPRKVDKNNRKSSFLFFFSTQ